MCQRARRAALHVQSAALPRGPGSHDRTTLRTRMTAPTRTRATAKSAVMRGRQRWLVLALSGAIFMINLDSRVIAPLLPTIADAFHTSVSSAGILITAYMLPYGLFQL